MKVARLLFAWPLIASIFAEEASKTSTPLPTVTPAPSDAPMSHKPSSVLVVPTTNPAPTPIPEPEPTPTPVPSSNATLSQSPTLAPVISSAPTTTTTTPAPTRIPTATPTVKPTATPTGSTHTPTTRTATPTPPPHDDHHEHQHPSLLRILGKTVAWLFIIALALLLFGFFMSNRYRIYYYARSAWFRFLRWEGTQWVLRKTGLGRLLGVQSSSRDGVLNDLIFDNDLDQGLLLQ